MKRALDERYWAAIAADTKVWAAWDRAYRAFEGGRADTEIFLPCRGDHPLPGAVEGSIRAAPAGAVYELFAGTRANGEQKVTSASVA